MKKIVLFFLFIFFAFTLISCGTDDKHSENQLREIVDFDHNADIEITFYHNFGHYSDDKFDSIIREFNKLYPNITVNRKIFTGSSLSYEMLQNSKKEGNLPNVVQLHPTLISKCLNDGLIQELDSYIGSIKVINYNNGTSDIIGLSADEQNKFVPQFLLEGRSYDSTNTTYSLPLTKYTDVLYYNKTVFELYGWEVPKTWDDVISISKLYLEIHPDSDTKKVPFISDSNSNLFLNLTKQWGGKFVEYNSNNSIVYSFGNSNSKAAMTFYKENFDKNYFATPKLFDELYASDVFVSGNAIMALGSCSELSYYVPKDKSFEVGITTYPQKDLNNAYVNFNGTNVALVKSEDQQVELASWLFMKFLTNYESVLDLSANVSTIPVRIDVLNSNEYANYINNSIYNKDNIVVANSQIDYFYVNPVLPNNESISNTVNTLINNILYDNKLIDEAYKNAIDNLLYS